MKKTCLYFDKKYKCVSFIVHYKGLTLRLNYMHWLIHWLNLVIWHYNSEVIFRRNPGMLQIYANVKCINIQTCVINENGWCLPCSLTGKSSPRRGPNQRRGCSYNTNVRSLLNFFNMEIISQNSMGIVRMILFFAWRYN